MNARKWKIGDIGRFLGNSAVATFKGELLLRLRADRWLGHIAFIVMIFMLLILFNIMVDSTLVKVEDNKDILHELEIQHTQKTYELVQIGRRSSVERLLEKSGSKVAEPTEPAKMLK